MNEARPKTQDHKPKAQPKPKAAAEEQPEEEEEAEEAVKSRVVTVHGHEWTIAPEALDDFELLDDLNEFDQHDSLLRMPSILRRLLGDEQAKTALDMLRDPDTRRVTKQAGFDFVFDLMGELNPN